MATPLTSVTIPSLSDVPNLPAQLLVAMSDAEKFFNLRFATTAARDAAIPTPIAGMKAWVTADGFSSVYTGTVWSPELDGLIIATDITPGILTNSMLSTVAGELGGAWATYVPTWTNLVQTGGSKIGRYHQEGKTVDMVARFTLGAGSSVTGSPTVTLPVTAQGNVGATQLQGVFWDASASKPYDCIVLLTTTTAQAFPKDTASTYSSGTAGSGTIPFVWTTSDWVEIAGRYEAA